MRRTLEVMLDTGSAWTGVYVSLYKQQQRFLHWADNRYRK
jgi:hypothetical protein